MINNVIDLAQQLISIPSVSKDKAKCRESLEVIGKLFESSDWKCEWFEHHESPSLLITPQIGKREFDLLLSGHIDVVSAPAEAFQPRISEGRLYGRGSADMKGVVAAMSYALLGFDPSNSSNIGLLITSDEETGGENGVKHLVEEQGLLPKTVFLPDGGADFQPCIFEKGQLVLEVISHGKAAHGARPWEGKNAIWTLIEDLRNVQDLVGSQQNEWSTTLNLGKIEAGQALNSVPHEARAWLDIRLGEDQTTESLLELLSDKLTHCQIKAISTSPSTHVDPESADFKTLLSLLQKRNLGKILTKEHGASDACWFSKVTSSILLVTAKCSAFHIDDEWVDLESLETFTEVIKEFIELKSLSPSRS